jgi:ubiquinone/menaquinone biosynthesis C-methylase UbiE
MLPVLGWMWCGNASAYAYILKSLKNYTAQKGVTSVLRHMGYNSVQVIEIMAGAMSIHKAIK